MTVALNHHSVADNHKSPTDQSWVVVTLTQTARGSLTSVRTRTLWFGGGDQTRMVLGALRRVDFSVYRLTLTTLAGRIDRRLLALFVRCRCRTNIECKNTAENVGWCSSVCLEQSQCYEQSGEDD